MKKNRHTSGNKKSQKRQKSALSSQIDSQLNSELESEASKPNLDENRANEEMEKVYSFGKEEENASSSLGTAFEEAANKISQAENGPKEEIKPPKRSIFKSNSFLFFLTALASILILVGAYFYISPLPKIKGVGGQEGIKAEVVKVTRRLSAAQELDGFDQSPGINIIFEARLLSGANKGQIVRAVQYWDADSVVPIKEVKDGDKVLLVKNMVSQKDYNLVFADYIRFDGLFWFILAFLAMLLIFGRSKGFRTILSLALTFGAIFLVLLPSILAGKNVYAWSIGSSVYIIIMTMAVAIGLNKKSLCAGLGCTLGSVACALLVILARNVLGLSGLGTDNALFLAEISKESPLDLNGIIFGAIIIGAVGAIMDVAMSISSSLFELKEKSPALSSKEIFSSGLTIGKDIMGTMANTLILAYIGSSLTMTLLMMAYDNNLLLLLNKETLIVEILQAIAGSMAILLTIPLTSGICAIALPKSQKDSEEVESQNNKTDLKIVNVGAPLDSEM